jgi:hypothetical protein
VTMSDHDPYAIPGSMLSTSPAQSMVTSPPLLSCA